MSWSDDSVNWFLSQAGRHPLLTASEELELSRKIKAWIAIRDGVGPSPTPEQRRIVRRGNKAFDRFFNGNLRLVVSVSKKYVRRINGISHGDLLQEGCLGLIRAIELFDPARGYKFSTYAYWWIRQGMTRALDQQDRIVRLPITASTSLSKARLFMSQFAAEHGRAPSINECAKHIGISVASLRNYLAMDQVYSLDVKQSNRTDDGRTLCELVVDSSSYAAPDQRVETDEMVGHLREGLQLLPEAHRRVLEERYLSGTGSPVTYIKIAEGLGVSRERIRQLEASAIRQLRAHFTPTVAS